MGSFSYEPGWSKHAKTEPNGSTSPLSHCQSSLALLASISLKPSKT